MAEPSSFTSRLLQQAMQPATRVPFAAAMQPTQAAPTSAQSTAAQRQRTAYLAALANPDMPIEPQFSTGSATADEQAIRRARAARMLAAGQAAVAERAQAQGRLQGTDPVTGAPIVGAAAPSPIVQESPGGVRVAYRNGVPVGFSTMTPPAQRPVTPTALLPQESAAVRQEATRLAADQSAARMRAAQILRAAGATAPAVAAAQAAPVAAPAPAPASATAPMSPPVGQTTSAQLRAGLAPVTGAVSPDGSTYSATGLPVLRSESVEELTPEEELAQAEQFLQEEVPAKRVQEERASYEQQIETTRRRLNQARLSGNAAEVALLSGQLNALLRQPPAKTLEEERRREQIRRAVLATRTM